jgi:hypothetical protein
MLIRKKNSMIMLEFANSTTELLGHLPHGNSLYEQHYKKIGFVKK